MADSPFDKDLANFPFDKGFAFIDVLAFGAILCDGKGPWTKHGKNKRIFIYHPGILKFEHGPLFDWWDGCEQTSHPL